MLFTTTAAESLGVCCFWLKYLVRLMRVISWWCDNPRGVPYHHLGFLRIGLKLLKNLFIKRRFPSLPDGNNNVHAYEGGKCVSALIRSSILQFLQVFSFGATTSDIIFHLSVFGSTPLLSLSLQLSSYMEHLSPQSVAVPSEREYKYL